MKNRFLTAALGALLALLSGCATGSFDPSRPIESNHSFFRERAYAQDGQALNIREMREKLEDIPASRADALSSAHWKVAAQASALATAGLLVGSIATSDSTQTWLLVGCIPTLVFEFVAFYISDSRLQDAVNEFNGHVREKPAHASIEPYLSITPTGAGVGGLSWAF
jgi:hypothetical protein